MHTYCLFFNAYIDFANDPRHKWNEFGCKKYIKPIIIIENEGVFDAIVMSILISILNRNEFEHKTDSYNGSGKNSTWIPRCKSKLFQNWQCENHSIVILMSTKFECNRLGARSTQISFLFLQLYSNGWRRRFFCIIDSKLTLSGDDDSQFTLSEWVSEWVLLF